MQESVGNLAYAKAMNREYKKAIQIYRGMLRSQQDQYGMTQPTIETLGILGFLYIRHQNNDEALKCLTAVYRWQQEHMDPNHPCARHTKDTIKRLEEKLQREVAVWI